MARDNSLLVVDPTFQEFSHEEFVTSNQEDLFGVHGTTNDEISNIPTHNRSIEDKNDRVTQKASIEDSLLHYSDGVKGGFGFDLQTKPLERDTYEDISLSELGGDLFKESTPQEECDEHFSFDQTISPLAFGILV